MQPTERHVLAGRIERQAVSSTAFDRLNRGFTDPGKRRFTKAEKRAFKKMRSDKGHTGVFDTSDDDEPAAYKGPWAEWGTLDAAGGGSDGEEGGEDSHDALAVADATASSSTEPIKIHTKKDTNVPEFVQHGQEKSVFHGSRFRDYLGRTYMHVPADTDVNLRSETTPECFLPKRCIHTWTGHTKQVNKVDVFPQSGHLFLSASNDTKVKLWDVYRDMRCVRTFMGHAQPVNDATFDPAGHTLLSASYDTQIKLWDTESGRALHAFSSGKVPYSVAFHPSNPNVFIAGTAGNKVIQYDARSGAAELEYPEHTEPVHSVVFLADGRFVSTSDDKSIRVWDLGVPVSTKLIQDPGLPTFSASVRAGDALLLQATDSRIYSMSARSLKLHTKRQYAGHTIGRHPIVPQVSPDGRIVSSGTAGGDLMFWNFSTAAVVGRVPVSESAVCAHAWLPRETSKVIVGGIDGVIKLWD